VLTVGGKYYVVQDNSYGYVLECTLDEYNEIVGRYTFSGGGTRVYIFEELAKDYVFDDKKEAGSHALGLLKAKLEQLKFVCLDIESKIDELSGSTGGSDE